MLQANDIAVIRGGSAILASVSARFEPGKLSVILGPNGAGKSTLLRVLTGTLRPDEGEVYLDGRPLSAYGIEELARHRAVLAQESLLQFDFSVEEVVLLGRIPHLSGWESSADHASCERALAALELLDMRYRRYPTLSGGEKQRVHLARVLAQLDPGAQGFSGQRWLFLDEPTAALDLRHQHTTLALARDLAARQQLGVVAVLHDLNLAMRYADEVLLLSRGRIAAYGTPEETLTEATIAQVYEVSARLITSPGGGPPFIQTQQSDAPLSHA